MTSYVSINGHVIRANAKNGTDEPPIRVAVGKNDRKPRYAREIEISGPCRLIYSDKFCCGDVSEIDFVERGLALGMAHTELTDLIGDLRREDGV